MDWSGDISDKEEPDIFFDSAYSYWFLAGTTDGKDSAEKAEGITDHVYPEWRFRYVLK